MTRVSKAAAIRWPLAVINPNACIPYPYHFVAVTPPAPHGHYHHLLTQPADVFAYCDTLPDKSLKVFVTRMSL